MLDYNAQIVKSLTSGVLAVDREGRIVLSNPAAAAHLNVSQSHLEPGMPIMKLPEGTTLHSVLEQVIQSGQAAGRQTLVIPSGNHALIEIGYSASPLMNEGDVSGVIFLFTNMTERRNLERAADLNRQMAQLGELTAGVVHELRNPLSVIHGMAELVERKANDDSDLEEIAKLIQKEASDIEKAIAQFLGFAKPYELSRAPCRPEDIARRALDLCARRAEKRGVRIESSLESELPTLSADVGLAAQALVNLLNNAIDASAENGTVRLSCHAAKSDVIFQVSDDGSGIQLEPGEDLFKPFFTRKEGGTGLGLSIVHRIVTAHGGTISHRNGTGGGAQFEIALPIEAGALRA